MLKMLELHVPVYVFKSLTMIFEKCLCKYFRSTKPKKCSWRLYTDPLKHLCLLTCILDHSVTNVSFKPERNIVLA